MRKTFDIFLTLNLVGLLVWGTYLYYTGTLQVTFSHTPEETLNQSAVAIFANTLRGEVDRTIGVPERGYEPEMFLTVFPGLVATDFAEVEASTGKYKIIDGQLEHVIATAELRHNAATAITSTGMATLLSNVANRLDVDLTTSGTLTEVMRAISNE